MKPKISRGQPLTEMFKGSLEYTQQQIRAAFDAQFYPRYEDVEGVAWEAKMRVCDTFADFVIVQAWEMPSDEFYQVAYVWNGDTIVFAPRAEWQAVELTFQPQTTAQQIVTDEADARRASGANVSPRGESNPPTKKGQNEGARKLPPSRRATFRERRAVRFDLSEAAGDKKLKTIFCAAAMTADIINENGRRYPAAVLEKAVNELALHLNESAGQGYLVQVLGEADHPSDKGKRASVRETVIKWNEVSFDGANVAVRGNILETAVGRDILALVEGGVTLSLSARGYGESEILKENGQMIEVVSDLHLTGFDIVLEPGFADAQAFVESRQRAVGAEESEMTIEQLKQLLEANPDLLKGITAKQIDEMGAAQLKQLEEKMRAALGLDAQQDLFKAMNEAVAAQKELAETKRIAAVNDAIADATKDLKYGKLNETFVAELKAQNAQAPDAVKQIAEAMKARYDALFAQAKLANMGFADVSVTGPVIEQESDTPAFARPAFEISEGLVKRGYIKSRDFRKPQTVNERFAKLVLERFDKQYQRQLLAEAKMLEEAETTADLNLPYGVSRAVLAAVWARAIAPGIFDYGVTDQAPTKIWYEQFTGETGKSGTVTDELTTASNPLGQWVTLANKQLNPGAVVLTNNAGSTTYVEGTDYVIDYFNGKWMALTGGAISAGQANLKIDYTYEAIRKGENAEIERGKMTLTAMTLEIAADRLAQQLTAEAVSFSRSQLGWDATARTLDSLIKELVRKIDQAALYMGLTSALRVANNNGGTWNQVTDPLSELPRVIGATRVKLAKRYYQPTALVLSDTNADTLGNWEGFTPSGKRPGDDIDAEGYAGRVKGLPVFHSTEFSDAYGLVVNRELVAYRVYQALIVKGPFPTYSNGKLVAADQYYVEEMNGMDSPLPEKGSFFKIQ